MKQRFGIIVALTAVAAPCCAGEASAKPTKIYLAVFDFVSTPARSGQQLSDSVRVMLRRHKEYEVIDKLTTRDAGGPWPIGTDTKKIISVMNEQLGVNAALCGSIEARGGGYSAKIRYVDLTDPKRPGGWVKEFADDTERARGVIATRIVEAVRNEAQWKPPEYGDEAEPKRFAKPINVNGRFEYGHKGWDPPDNVATLIERGPAGRGKVLRLHTNLERAPWIEYRRKLRFGLADPKRPPKIGPDNSYASVAGMEGVDYLSQWFDATPGQRYWLLADMKGKTAGIFFPKIFVKGYLDYSAEAAALPEVSLVARKMTARQFAALPAERRKKLIADDVRQHPDRYRRECFRWYLSCRNEEDVWKHYAAPFPPRGGLPKNVKWLRIVVYAYWPPGDFVFDDVMLYKDPRQKAPLPEEKARTKHFKSGVQPQPK